MRGASRMSAAVCPLAFRLRRMHWCCTTRETEAPTCCAVTSHSCPLGLRWNTGAPFSARRLIELLANTGRPSSWVFWLFDLLPSPFACSLVYVPELHARLDTKVTRLKRLLCKHFKHMLLLKHGSRLQHVKCRK